MKRRVAYPIGLSAGQRCWHSTPGPNASARTYPEQDGRASAKNPKGRLERAKAAVAQQAAHAKREKAKLRRRAKASDGANAQHDTTTSDGEKPAENSGAAKLKPKKRVTFG
ncbi:hypothetical protein V8D89_004338 [Ganoderma adspersum]